MALLMDAVASKALNFLLLVAPSCFFKTDSTTACCVTASPDFAFWASLPSK